MEAENMDLRSTILEHSLIIEYGLKEWLKVVLRIDQDNLKSLGTKGSSLSAKSKLDLLFDIGLVEDELYKNILLFFEIRNKLIHNIEITSLVDVFAIIKQKQRLLNIWNDQPNITWKMSIEDFHDEKSISSMEHNLYFVINEAILKGRINTMEKLQKQEEEKRINRIYKLSIELISDSIKDFSREFRDSLISTEITDDSDLDTLIHGGIVSIFKRKIGEKFNMDRSQ